MEPDWISGILPIEIARSFHPGSLASRNGNSQATDTSAEDVIAEPAPFVPPESDSEGGKVLGELFSDDDEKEQATTTGAVAEDMPVDGEETDTELPTITAADEVDDEEWEHVIAIVAVLQV